MACAMSISLTKDPTLYRWVDDTGADYREFHEEMNEKIALELDSIWQKIKDLAIDLCPKESGALASSIELESEGGSGVVGVQGSVMQGQVIYQNAIFAGNDETFNFDGQPTSQYALAQHDGFLMKNGEFFEGTPFLTDAVDFYNSELEEAVNRALDELMSD